MTGIASSSEESSEESSTFFASGCFVGALFCTGVAIVLPGVTNFFAGGSSSDEDSSEDSFFETGNFLALEILVCVLGGSSSSLESSELDSCFVTALPLTFDFRALTGFTFAGAVFVGAVFAEELGFSSSSSEESSEEEEAAAFFLGIPFAIDSGLGCETTMVFLTVLSSEDSSDDDSSTFLVNGCLVAAVLVTGVPPTLACLALLKLTASLTSSCKVGDPAGGGTTFNSFFSFMARGLLTLSKCWKMSDSTAGISFCSDIFNYNLTKGHNAKTRMTETMPSRQDLNRQ